MTIFTGFVISFAIIVFCTLFNLLSDPLDPFRPFSLCITASYQWLTGVQWSTVSKDYWIVSIFRFSCRIKSSTTFWLDLLPWKETIYNTLVIIEGKLILPLLRHCNCYFGPEYHPVHSWFPSTSWFFVSIPLLVNEACNGSTRNNVLCPVLVGIIPSSIQSLQLLLCRCLVVENMTW